MNVSCTKCGKRYVIADEKLAGKTSVKIRCKQCQSLITVAVTGQVAAVQARPAAAAAVQARPAAAAAPAPAGALAQAAHAAGLEGNPWESERTTAAPPMDLSASWYAMIHGKQTGPLGLRQLMELVNAGEVTLRTYLWKPGMADWKRANDVGEVSPVFAGVSVGAAPAPQRARVPSKPTPAVQARTGRDVAVANEMPAPGVTTKAGNGNGNGNGHGQHAPAARSTQPPRAPPPTGMLPAIPRRTGMYGVATPIAAPEPAPAPAPAPAPEAEPAPARQSEPLDDLFNDVPQPSADNLPAVQLQDSSEQAKSDKFDPFSALAPPSQSELPPPGEATRFFIAQAGLNRRNPLWKIALFVASLIGLPTAALYLASTLHYVELPTVTRLTDDGQEVQESFFSTGGISGLKDSLTGEAKRRRAEAEKKRLEEQALAQLRRPAVVKAERPDDPPLVKKPPDPKLAEFYAENPEGKPRVPKNRLEGNTTGHEVNKSGLSDEVAAKKIGENQKAFQACIDNALRRNPGLAVGNITVVLTIGPSGAVKSASVDPRKHEGSDWAQCMMSAGKRLVFPASDGETEVQAPFKVGVTL